MQCSRFGGKEENIMDRWSIGSKKGGGEWNATENSMVDWKIQGEITANNCWWEVWWQNFGRKYRNAFISLRVIKFYPTDSKKRLRRHRKS